MIYRTYRLNFCGHVLDLQELDCETDAEVASLASELFGEEPVEVWLGPRRIARLIADDRR